ncbi:UDP-4-amino-4,6-dideoxy-N-acetyl-beta-L-altrosamine N-acetyltransferase [Campylobacter sp.]|uniref:UDP-4-amino-4, 6-dideoxy-N-acetyl-beta-L-altrosamine N-acetyltransferase n=1 Tax=Campylobacter sp. TaxID=205 RepID=UPI0025C40BFA|nr:UDP-4-amino-4,6-dideoxy-N-acetyl-beta-L-altrosamine N-acetyltransferase [Campylobacter sp.]
MKLNLKLKNFIDLNDFEKNLILQYRNKKQIAKFMKNSHIDFNEHLNFLSNLKNDLTKKYFLVYDDNEAIGVIDFTHITPQTCDFGLYGIKKNVGDILMNEVKTYAFNVLKVQILKAYVFKNNTKALNLYTKHNFYIYDENSEFYFIKLDNPNWNIIS